MSCACELWPSRLHPKLGCPGWTSVCVTQPIYGRTNRFNKSGLLWLIASSVLGENYILSCGMPKVYKRRQERKRQKQHHQGILLTSPVAWEIWPHPQVPLQVLHSGSLSFRSKPGTLWQRAASVIKQQHEKFKFRMRPLKMAASFIYVAGQRFQYPRSV